MLVLFQVACSKFIFSYGRIGGCQNPVPVLKLQPRFVNRFLSAAKKPVLSRNSLVMTSIDASRTGRPSVITSLNSFEFSCQFSFGAIFLSQSRTNSPDFRVARSMSLSFPITRVPLLAPLRPAPSPVTPGLGDLGSGLNLDFSFVRWN